MPEHDPIPSLPANLTQFDQPDSDQVKNDFDFARQNMYDILSKSQEAMEDMLDVARQSQHPRAYEVLNQMFKNIADVSKDLVDLQKKKKDILKTEPVQEGPQTVNNNLFVGTTADLNRMIEEAQAKKLEKPEEE